MKSPKEIIDLMLKEDAFSNLLGMEIEEVEKGKCTLSMLIASDHVNGFNITHGGIAFSLADSAIAFAANAYGNKAVTIENSISYVKPSFLGNRLIAICTEVNKGKTVARYNVKLQNQKNELVANINGLVHFSNEIW